MNDLAALWAVYGLLYVFNHVRLVPLDWVGVVVSPFRRRRRYRLILPNRPFRFGRKQLILLSPLRPHRVVFNAGLSPRDAMAALEGGAGFPSLLPLVVLQSTALLALLVVVPLLSVVSLERALLAFAIWHLLFWLAALLETRRTFSGHWRLACLPCAAIETLFNLASTPTIGSLMAGRANAGLPDLAAITALLSAEDRADFLAGLDARLADMVDLNEIDSADAALCRQRLEPAP